MKIFERIDIWRIFREHQGTLYHYGNLNFKRKKTATKADIIIFLIAPFLIAFGLVFLGLRISDTYLNILTTFLAIFVGLLFNLLTLVFDLIKRAKDRKEKNIATNTSLIQLDVDDVSYTLTKELFINIAFAIVLSIVALVVSLLTRFKPEPIVQYLTKRGVYETCKYIYLVIFNSAAFFLLIEFLLTLLMILNRFFLLFLKEIDHK